MNSALGQLAILVGTTLFLLSFAMGLIREIPFFVVLWRSSVVLGVSVLISALLFRYFSTLLRSLVERHAEEAKDPSTLSETEAESKSQEQAAASIEDEAPVS